MTTLEDTRKGSKKEAYGEGTSGEAQKKDHKNPTLRFNILPSKRSLYTFQKAPMAHKTNSKEQFMFKFYFFKLDVSASVDPKLIPNSVNAGLMTYYLMRHTFPVFETNVLFLKYYRIKSMYLDSDTFNFHKFLSNKS